MQKPNIVVIDYGVGNLLSVERGFQHHNIDVCVTSDKEKILTASHVVLPGVGAFGKAMAALDERDLIGTIKALGAKETPLLGICLGMQLLLEESEEFGRHEGLGLIPGKVVPIPTHSLDGKPLKSPHIGWGELKPRCYESDWMNTALDQTKLNDTAYFVHSYMSVPSNQNHIIAETDFGGNKIPAVLSYKKILACQFHPEKSSEVGLKILKRFCDC